MPAELPDSSKIRVAAGLLEALQIVSEKNKEVRTNGGKCLSAVVKYNPIEFEKDSKKTKDQLIEDSELDVEKYEEKADQCIKAHNMEKNEAEKWLTTSKAPKVQTSSNADVDQWSQFKPQQNLEPIHLEQGVSHLDVTKFVEAIRTYITVGFRARR